jgi:hypothetical protein
MCEFTQHSWNILIIGKIIKEMPGSVPSGTLCMYKTSLLMQRGEISVFCPEIQTKHTNTLCWQHIEFFNIKLCGIYSGYWVFNYKEWPTIGICNSKQSLLCMISGFRREADEICALLGCYAAYGVNFSRTFRVNI